MKSHSLTDSALDLSFRPDLADLTNLSNYDLVIVAVKTGALPSLLPQLAAAMRPDALLMPAINGLPWWYFLSDSGPLAGRPLHAVDPGGALLPLFAPERLIGCVVYSRVTMLASGHVIVSGRQELQLGVVGGETVPMVEPAFESHGRARRIVGEITWLRSHTGDVDLVHHGGGTAPVLAHRPYVLTIHENAHCGHNRRIHK